MTCEYETRCLNNAKCYRCFEGTLLKLPEDKVRKQRQQQRPKTRNAQQPPWRQFEEQVTRKLNATPTIVELGARRQPGSGNQVAHPGDSIDEVVLVECKDHRTITARGKKVHTIHQDWLEKNAQEAGVSRKPLYVFRFAEDDQIYAIFEFDDVLSLIHEVKVLRAEVANQGLALKAAYEKLNQRSHRPHA